MEILTLNWSSSSTVLKNYLNFPDAFKSVLGMMSEPKLNPEVYELHLNMLKSIVLKSIQGLEDKKDLAFLHKKSRNDESDIEMDQEDLL